METLSGGCLCGAKRYTAKIADFDAYLCHCRMCQRAAGAMALALKDLPTADVRWETEPERYRSSGFAQRGFCATCGTSLTYESDGHDRMDLTIASFDDAARFRPVGHAGAESWHPAWLDTSGLPAERTQDNKRIVAAWEATLGHVPD